MVAHIGKLNTNNTSSTFLILLQPVSLAGTRAISLPTQPRCLPRPRCHPPLQDPTTIGQPPYPRALPPHPVSRRAALVASAPDGCCATTWEGGPPPPHPAPPRSTHPTVSAPPRPPPTTVSSFQTPFPTSVRPLCQWRSSTALQPARQRPLGASRVRGNHLP